MLQSALERNGFALAPAIATPGEVANLIATFEQAEMVRAERSGQTFGARNLLDLPNIRIFAASQTLSTFLLPLLGPRYLAVRGLFFDKTEGANWPVLWHQDLLLAVKEKRELPGWGNWSIKRSVPHVQPPAAILSRMVTMRLHLDDCDAYSGPLRVIAGSHADGTLSREDIRARTLAGSPQTVVAKAGDALFMRPLILHASSPAIRPRHRRVLHLEFAPDDLLPSALAWAETSPSR